MDRRAINIKQKILLIVSVSKRGKSLIKREHEIGKSRPNRIGWSPNTSVDHYQFRHKIEGYTFDFAPKFLAMGINGQDNSNYYKGTLLIYGQSEYDGFGNMKDNGGLILNWGANSILWYTVHNTAAAQYNKMNTNYFYVAIG